MFVKSWSGVFEESVDLPCDVAFETPSGFSGGLAFGGSFGMSELLVGLGDVDVVGGDEWGEGHRWWW